MTLLTAIDLVIFDCDGVLIDSESLSCRAVSEFLVEQGFPYSPKVIADRFIGYSDAEMAKVIADEQGRPLPSDFPRQVADRAVVLFEGHLKPLPGAAVLLGRLPCDKAVASNSLRGRLVRSLQLTGLDTFFADSRVFSSQDVARPKPAPDLYELAARTCGVAPARCLVVEDSITGTTAARAAGIMVIGFVGASPEPDQQKEKLLAAGAASVVESFAGLSSYLGLS
ncbi:MAG: HAD-IA family hydrolase [Pseudomonadota bacterium]